MGPGFFDYEDETCRFEILKSLREAIKKKSTSAGWDGVLDLSVIAVRNILFPVKNASSNADAMQVDAKADAIGDILVPLTDSRVPKLTGLEIAELKADFKHANVTDLNLEGHDISGRGANKFVEMMKHNPQLKKVDISGNPLGQVGNAILTREILQIADEKMAVQMAESSASKIQKASVKDQKAIAIAEVLIIGINNFNVCAFFPKLHTTDVLNIMMMRHMQGGSTILNLGACLKPDAFFAHPTAMPCLTGFMKNNQLREIDLSGTDLFVVNQNASENDRNNFSQALAITIANQKSLEVLVLDNNEFLFNNLDRGINFLITILRGAVFLRELYLSITGLNRRNIARFAEAIIAIKPKLTTLGLSKNALIKCTNSIVNVVQAIPSLKSLLLDNCPLNDDEINDYDDEFTQLIIDLNKRDRDAKDENCRLKTLSIGPNFVGEKTINQLTEWLSAPYCRLRKLAVQIDDIICDEINASIVALIEAVKAKSTITYTDGLLDDDLSTKVELRRRATEERERDYLTHWCDVAAVSSFACANINSPYANSILPLCRIIFQLADLNLPTNRLFISEASRNKPAQVVTATVAATDAGKDVVMADSKAASASASANSGTVKRKKLFFDSLFFGAHLSQPTAVNSSAAAASAVSPDTDIAMADAKESSNGAAHTNASRKRKM